MRRLLGFVFATMFYFEYFLQLDTSVAREGTEASSEFAVLQRQLISGVAFSFPGVIYSAITGVGSDVM